jgi:hypothetical protein
MLETDFIDLKNGKSLVKIYSDSTKNDPIFEYITFENKLYEYNFLKKEDTNWAFRILETKSFGVESQIVYFFKRFNQDTGFHFFGNYFLN